MVFSAEILNQPIDNETAVFKREWSLYRKFEDLESKQTPYGQNIGPGSDSLFWGENSL